MNKNIFCAIKAICFSMVACSSIVASEGKLFLSPSKIETMCQELYEQAKNDDFTPDLIIGLARGGLMPLVYLSGEKMFDIRNVLSISVQSYEGTKQGTMKLTHPWPIEAIKTNKSVLIVDDLTDTGETLEFIIKKLKKTCPDAIIKTAVLLRKPYSTIVPNYWVEATNQWVVFPWEKNN